MTMKTYDNSMKRILFFSPERPASVCREISKVHEESVRGSLTELITHFTEHPPKGEIVIVVGGSGN